MRKLSNAAAFKAGVGCSELQNKHLPLFDVDVMYTNSLPFAKDCVFGAMEYPEHASWQPRGRACKVWGPTLLPLRSLIPAKSWVIAVAAA